jgi:hypothetical protein
MDLETLFTTVYVLVDDWYKEQMAATFQRTVGAPAKMSDSEVLTVAVVGQWRIGVPWQTERGLVRYLQTYGRAMFPTMLNISAFNRRVRCLWGAFVLLQQGVAQALQTEADIYECVDCLPLPAFSNGQAQRERGHWLWQSTRGRGGHGRWFWGDHLLLSVAGGGRLQAGWWEPPISMIAGCWKRS